MAEDFAKAVGGTIVAAYSIPGHSRDIIFFEDAAREMPAYADLRRDVEAKRLDVLHVADPDRLARDPALAQTVISMCEKNGCEVYFASSPHPVGQKSYSSRYVESIMLTRAGEMQQIRVARHSTGVSARVKRGLAASHWPIGYRPVRDAHGTVVGAEFDENIGAVRLATDMFLAGQPFSAIRRVLNESPWRAPKSPDGQWRHAVVWRMMKNDTYAGYPSWRGVRPEQPSDRFPALWDADTYRAILRERQARHHEYRRSKRVALSGIVWCARCGGKMSRSRRKHSSAVLYYYRCTNHTRRSVANTPACHANCTRRERIIEAVEIALRRALTEEGIERIVARLQPRDGHAERLADLERQVAAVQAKRDRLALAYAAGNMDAEMYRRTDDVLLTELEAGEAAAGELRREIAAMPDPDERRVTLESLRGQVGGLFEKPDAEANRLLKSVGVRVWCEARQVIRVEVRGMPWPPDA